MHSKPGTGSTSRHLVNHFSLPLLRKAANATEFDTPGEAKDQDIVPFASGSGIIQEPSDPSTRVSEPRPKLSSTPPTGSTWCTTGRA